MLTRFLDPDSRSSGAYLGRIMYGANDGTVTAFAVVAGVAGAALDPGVAVILGVANPLADGFSMGMSNYLSRQADIASQTPVGETTGIEKAPVYTALVTLVAFVIAGWAPPLPYTASVRPFFELSVATTAGVFFPVGASRTFVTERSWYRSGAETLSIGLVAAGVADGAGIFLSGGA